MRYCFTETWLYDLVSNNMINIDGFDIIRNDRPHKKGGGTCLYVNHRLHYRVCLPNLSQPEVEIQSIMLLGNGNETQTFKPIIIVLIYRPPQGIYKKAKELIENYVNSIPDLNRSELVIMGDLNWDYLDTTNQGWKYLNELEIEFGISQTIKVPTRYGSTKASLIDVVMTNMNNVLASGCIDIAISDHYPIIVIKKRRKLPRKFEYKFARNYKGYDADQFTDNLVHLDWSIFDMLTDVDDMWTMILQAITHEMNHMCPIKKIKINISKPEWFSSELYELAKERDRLFRKFRQGNRKKSDNLSECSYQE